LKADKQGQESSSVPLALLRRPGKDAVEVIDRKAAKKPQVRRSTFRNPWHGPKASL
jgi:hypothetical protein